MQANDVKELLQEQLDGAEVLVEGEGCDFRLTIVSGQFEGLSAVKRQQLVYGHLNHLIADGTIHAVTMTTLTPAEQQAAGA